MALTSVSNFASTAPSVSAYQEMLSNTAHQREISDLKAAGLNPVLSASSSGASTPSGDASEFGINKILSALNTSAKAMNTAVRSMSRSAKKTEDEKDLLDEIIDSISSRNPWINTAINVVRTARRHANELDVNIPEDNSLGSLKRNVNGGLSSNNRLLQALIDTHASFGSYT